MESGSVTGINPFDQFSVGYGTGGSFTAFGPSYHTNAYAGNANIQGYFVNNPQIAPVVAVNVTNTPTIMNNIGSTLGSNYIFMHPGAISTFNAEGGPIQDAILRFTAPITGLYTVVGDWVKMHFGTTSDQILVNGVLATPATSGTSSFNFAKQLNANDHVDFVVNPAGVIAGDSTGLRATLTLCTPPQVLQGGACVLPVPAIVGALPTPDKFTSQVAPFALNNLGLLSTIASQNGNNAFQVAESTQQQLTPASDDYLKDAAKATVKGLNILTDGIFMATTAYGGFVAGKVAVGTAAAKAAVKSVGMSLGRRFGFDLALGEAKVLTGVTGGNDIAERGVLLHKLETTILNGCVKTFQPNLAAPLVACIANVVAFDIKHGLVPYVDAYGIDPPNPNYTVVTAVNIPTTNLGDSAIKPTIDALRSAQAYLAAVNETYDRYVSAYNAGDTNSALLQIQAYLTFLERYNAAILLARPGILEIQNSIAAVDLQVIGQDILSLIAETQQEIAANGLDVDIVDFLKELGLDEVQILEVQNDILSFQYTPNGNLRDNFMGLLGGLDAVSVPNAVPAPGSAPLTALAMLMAWLVMRRTKLTRSVGAA